MSEHTVTDREDFLGADRLESAGAVVPTKDVPLEVGACLSKASRKNQEMMAVPQHTDLALVDLPPRCSRLFQALIHGQARGGLRRF